ncbi:MAG: hypothetical protein AAFY88_15345, partial [Acidobacteriota bacterium]
RLGVGPPDGEPPEALSDFVLGEFETDESAAVEAMIARAADACEMWLGPGAAEAMQRFNGPAPAPSAPSSGKAEL